MNAEFEQQAESTVEPGRQIYSATVIDHATNPRNAGSIPLPSSFASVTGPCGDTMEIWLAVNEGRIEKATFWTDGCETSIACGSMATELVKGKNTEEAQRLTQDDILKALEGLPEESTHCALLAANTIQAAIKEYLAIRSETEAREMCSGRASH